MTPGGSGAVAPVFMTCKSVGGADWNYDSITGAGQKGLSGAAGINNVGLLVRVFGRVTQGLPGDPGPIVIDDGSGVMLQVALPSGATSPGAGAHVVATGVISCAQQGVQLDRLLLAASVQLL